jgi:hypothetical protein
MILFRANDWKSAIVPFDNSSLPSEVPLLEWLKVLRTAFNCNFTYISNIFCIFLYLFRLPVGAPVI